MVKKKILKYQDQIESKLKDKSVSFWNFDQMKIKLKIHE